jgi:hypothetical protein
MPTINCPALVCFRLIWRNTASAGGQLEHPSEVKSSTITTEPGLSWTQVLTRDKVRKKAGGEKQKPTGQHAAKLHGTTSSGMRRFI